MKSIIALFLSVVLVAANPLIVISGKPPAGGAGPDTWYDSVDPALTDVAYNLGTGDISGAPITPAASGTCTKLRIRLGDIFADSTVKMALYTSGGNLLASGSVATGSSGTDVWVEVSLGAGAAVTASTVYHVAFVASVDGNATIRTRTGQPSGSGLAEFTYTYATFPPATISFGNSTEQFSLGMYVD